jgi:hypothetical protein
MKLARCSVLALPRLSVEAAHRLSCTVRQSILCERHCKFRGVVENTVIAIAAVAGPGVEFALRLARSTRVRGRVQHLLVLCKYIPYNHRLNRRR